jgi:hypothetical protein
MLGDQIGESSGKRLVRRVLSVDPVNVEVSFEDTGTMLGVPCNGTGTYTSTVRPDGSIYGEGQGVVFTQDGDGISWTGTGLGSFGAGGSVSYRGMLYYRTDSQKMSRMNNMAVAFEFDVDGAGNTSSKMWEWKGSAAAMGKGA